MAPSEIITNFDETPFRSNAPFYITQSSSGGENRDGLVFANDERPPCVYRKSFIVPMFTNRPTAKAYRCFEQQLYVLVIWTTFLTLSLKING